MRGASRVRKTLLAALAVAMGASAAMGPSTAYAQAPRARVSLDPGAVVTVGQPLTVRVQVLVPSFFAGAPAFPELDVDDAITIFVDRGTNFTEREGAVTWAGQTRSYTVYPQRVGSFEIAEIAVEVRYRGDAGLVNATATTPPIRFEARIPPEAAGLDYFIAAGDLTLEESFDVRPDTIRVGEAFSRTLTVTVRDALSMVIPPFEADSVPGLAVYPAPPRVDDSEGERGAAIIGTRIESVSYVAQAEGEYVLPAVGLSWWDVGAQRLREAGVPEVRFVVVANPDLVNELGLPPDSIVAESVVGGTTGRFSLADFVRRWGPILAAVVLLLALAVRIARRYGPGWATGLHEAKRAHAESERTYFRRFRAASRASDPRATANTLMAWLDRADSGPGPATFERFASGAHDPGLDQQAEALGNSLYGQQATVKEDAWSSSAFYTLVAKARKKGREAGGPTQPAGGLKPLNPEGGCTTDRQS